MTKRQLNQHQREAVNEIETYLKSIDVKKADKFAYWLKDYTRFLKNERNRHQKYRYKRGSIVQAHLGHNIGSEFGGLHYCVVVENNNSIHSPIITVIPMRSVKEKDNPRVIGILGFRLLPFGNPELILRKLSLYIHYIKKNKKRNAYFMYLIDF